MSKVMDVDNELDYKEMVWKICDATCDLMAMKIFVNMKHVKKLPSHQANAQSGDKESSGMDDIQVFSLFTIAQACSNMICQPPSWSTSEHLDICLASLVK